jgi:hypothetical protein
MEWAVAGIMGLGAIWYFILAMMGSSRPDNLKGFRWKLFAMCLMWPVTLAVLCAVVIWRLRRADCHHVGIDGIVERQNLGI